METKYPFTPWPSLSSNGKQISTQDGTLFYFDCKPKNSASDPTLVFIHGLGDEADTWRHVIPLFNAKGYRCIAIDLPGFGRSIWHGKINVRRHADAVIEVINDCGITGCNTVLVGSSMGCGIAELAATKRPDLIKSLILICGCFPIKGSINIGLVLFGLFGRKWYRNFRKDHEGAWKSLFPYYHDLENMNEEDKKFLRERVIARVESDNQERGYFASLRSITSDFVSVRGSLSRDIKKFNGKIDLIWGEHDRIMPKEKTKSLLKLRPDATLTTITDVGHHPQTEKPKETVDAILSLIK